MKTPETDLTFLQEAIRTKKTLLDIFGSEADLILTEDIFYFGEMERICIESGDAETADKFRKMRLNAELASSLHGE